MYSPPFMVTKPLKSVAAGNGSIVELGASTVSSVWEEGVIYIWPFPGSLAVNISANEAGSNGTISSSILHIPVSKHANASGSAQVSRNLFQWWGGGSSLLCQSSAFHAFNISAPGSYSFSLNSQASPWSTSECSAALGSNPDQSALSLTSLDGVTTINVVGPVTWTRPSPVPLNSSESPVNIEVVVGPSEKILISDTPMLLQVYDKNHPERQRWFEILDGVPNTEWDGVLYHYQPRSGFAQPLIQTGSPQFYLSHSDDYDMALEVLVENQFGLTGSSVQERLIYHYDYFQNPNPTVDLSVYNQFE